MSREDTRHLRHFEKEEDGLIHAAGAGLIGIVRILCRRKHIDINQPDCNGITPIFAASRYGHLDVVRVLMEYGADINCPTIRGNTPIHYASLNGHQDVVKVLVEAGANIECTNILGCTPIHYASVKGHLDLLRFLADSGADINCSSAEGATPLILASEHGSATVVSTLLELGAGSAVDAALFESGTTALYLASQNGHVDSVCALIEAGANVDWVTKIPDTPMNIAIMKEHLDVVRVLTYAGAKLDIKYLLDAVAIVHSWAHSSCPTISTFLVEVGVDLDGAKEYLKTMSKISIYDRHIRLHYLQKKLEHRHYLDVPSEPLLQETT